MSPTLPRTARILMIVLTLALSTAVAQKRDQGELQLKAAIQKETVDGDLKAAIAEYQKLIKSGTASRPVKARALLQLGGCYEKQGDNQARKTFEQLLKDYSDIREIAVQARTRLSNLASAPENEEQSSGPLIRQFWSSPERIKKNSSISPDGRYLLYQQENLPATGKEGFFLKDLSDGTTRLLTETDLKSSTPEFPGNFSWAPDSRKLAYICYFSRKPNELRIRNLADQAPQVLYIDPDDSMDDVAWSPDGQYILTFFSGNKTRPPRTELFSVKGGSTKTFTLAKSCRDLVYSSNGRHVACFQENSRTPSENSVCLYDVETGSMTSLIGSKGAASLIGWTPDGNALLFTMERAGTIGIWKITVVNGGQQGSEELLRPNVGPLDPIGIRADGSFYYSSQSRVFEIYVVAMDATGLKPVSAPVRINRPAGMRIRGPAAWSPDGKTLAYFGSESSPTVLRVDAVCFLTMNDGHTRTVKLNKEIPSGPLAWSDDYHLVSRDGLATPNSLCRIDIGTGEVELIDTGVRYAWEWSQDGSRILYDADPAHATDFWEKDLISGRQREVYRPAPSNDASIRVSPDWKSVMLTEAETMTGKPKSFVLSVLKLADGSKRELTRRSDGNYYNFLGWSSDSTVYIYGCYPPGTLGNSESFAIPLIGGEPSKIDFGVPFAGRVVAHPDGKRYAVWASSAGPTEFWVMENFLPPAKNKGK
jgi:Tol biopolymer transport system component